MVYKSLQFTDREDIVKTSQWEKNQNCILNYIHLYTVENCKSPSISNIATNTGLSRPTIYKHLSETNVQDYLGKQFRTYHLLIPQIMGMLYSKCFNLLASEVESLRAAKTILELLQFSSKYSNYITINKQVNYLTINNTTITQDQLQKLSPDKLSEIEGLINDA